MVRVRIVLVIPALSRKLMRRSSHRTLKDERERRWPWHENRSSQRQRDRDRCNKSITSLDHHNQWAARHISPKHLGHFLARSAHRRATPDATKLTQAYRDRASANCLKSACNFSSRSVRIRSYKSSTDSSNNSEFVNDFDKLDREPRALNSKCTCDRARLAQKFCVCNRMIAAGCTKLLP